MGKKRGTFITTDQWLGVDDYLVSANGFFFAIMQGDGNFCVYRGSGPETNQGYVWGTQATGPDGRFFAIMQGDGNFCVYRGSSPQTNEGYLWGTQATAPGGAFFAILQDDANFCIYKGPGPDQNQGGLWCSMAIDPVVSVEISNIEYDVAAATVLQSGAVEMYREIVRNDTAYLQSSSIIGSKTVTETSGWSNALGGKVNVSVQGGIGIPLLAEAKVTVSAEVSNTFTWNGSTARSKTWGFNTPVSVPPHATLTALIAAKLSTIVVPYTLHGTFVLQSGARMNGSVRGTYTGTNSHDLTVTFVEQSLTGDMSVSRPAALAS